jgi:hypothetical protein
MGSSRKKTRQLKNVSFGSFLRKNAPRWIKALLKFRLVAQNKPKGKDSVQPESVLVSTETGPVKRKRGRAKKVITPEVSAG